MPNQIMIIVPYWLEAAGTWVFDDPATDLKQEPFVEGIPEMIDDLIADIPNARNGFRLLFSAGSVSRLSAETDPASARVGRLVVRLGRAGSRRVAVPGFVPVL